MKQHRAGTLPARRRLGRKAVTRNRHIASLGFRLEETRSIDKVRPLLRASGVEPLREAAQAGPWEPSTYLVSCTAAGGISACVGWTRSDECIVLHSLAVASPSRGSGIGASLLATVLGEAMDDKPVEAIYLTTRSAKRFFADFSFELVEPDTIPYGVRAHPAFAHAPSGSFPMVRRYKPQQPGLDQCAFRLIHNTTDKATLPPGSVFLFRQSGSTLEAQYRGTPVKRGHLIGAIKGEQITFRWHQALENGELASGSGKIIVSELDDGRRELREKLGQDPGELLLREV
ncbi:GNAT family N-acetyltransferase [Persicimonas caeni]|uniref:GNAT family N-acetyltransferase n=1 Tax=Persicimonas caeni TaxID=2292766 RepID=A0A4Y6PXM7_PERCE|nr:GNAT family N-acetyltransferase [Persicimonas caeni]QED33969.1 GNAT family N-acetyltransferase [Persicimonas caeni]